MPPCSGDVPLVQPLSRKLPGVDVEVDALRAYLRDIAATDEALGGGPEPFDSFVARLERKLDASAVILREAGGVLLAPMHTLHGLRFDHVALGGLVQGEFPAQRTGTALLDSDARELLNGTGLALPPEPHVAEDDLWASARTRADRSLALWKTRLDDRGRPAAASYYFDQLPHDRTLEATTIEPGYTASRRELYIACSRQWQEQGHLRPQGRGCVGRSCGKPSASSRCGVRSAMEEHTKDASPPGSFRGSQERGRYGVPRASSPTGHAPSSFFSNYALRLSELEEEMDSADAATRGDGCPRSPSGRPGAARGAGQSADERHLE